MKSIGCHDLYHDARHYDAKNSTFKDDIPFYENLLKKYGGPVLELACGTGRLTNLFAERGIDITGVDISESMLKHARDKAGVRKIKVEFINVDIRDFHLDKKFKFIFFPFNSIAHLLENEDLEACFKCVKEHLDNDGRFVIDIFRPSLAILQRDPDKIYSRENYPDPEGGIVTVTEQTSYDHAAQIMDILWRFELSRGCQKPDIKFKIRILFPQELNTLLRHSGFVIESKFGNYDLSAFGPNSPKRLVVCRKR